MWRSRVPAVMERKHERGECMARIIMCGVLRDMISGRWVEERLQIDIIYF